MHCSECGANVSEAAKFCGECGNNLKAQEGVNITSGDQSVNFGQGNEVSGNTININSNDEAKDQAYIDRTKVKPLSIAGTQLKASWLVATGILSFFGSIASILGFFGTGTPPTFVPLIMLGVILLPVGLALIQTKHLSLPPFLNLETGKEGEIYITKIEGSCPKCTGSLKLRSIGSKNNKSTVVRCTRNPDHLWGFDPTVLSDL